MDIVVVYIIIFFALVALCIICPRRENTNNTSTDLNFYRFAFIDNDTENTSDTSSQISSQISSHMSHEISSNESSLESRSSPLSVISV